MTQALNVNRLVRVSVNLAPIAAARRGFGTLLIVGDSNVIGYTERVRSYTDLESVAQDFGTSAPEYDGALLYFGQTPRPTNLMIGRWLREASAGVLAGGVISSIEQELGNWTTIEDGSFKINIDGDGNSDITGLDFSTVENMADVAAVITAELSSAICTWNGSRFSITSSSTGATSSVSYADDAATGTAMAAQLKLSTDLAGSKSIGWDAEDPVDAVAVFSNLSGSWYGITFCCDTMPDTQALLDVGAFIEASSSTRIFGVTETSTDVLDPNDASDLASVFKARSYKRTCVQYSAHEFAICSLLGRAFSVNFSANKSAITLMYKTEPGVVAEGLSETNAQTLKTKRCNVFANYRNDTALIQYGVMSGPAYIDEIHGLDWFADALQTAEYNLLYQSKTKIPQTDAGQNELVNIAAGVCAEAVNNGLVAPGTWNADGFGQLDRGDFLSEGYYIFTSPMATQDQSIREQRIAPPIQIALKLAGAIHEIDCIVDVNR